MSRQLEMLRGQADVPSISPASRCRDACATPGDCTAPHGRGSFRRRHDRIRSVPSTRKRGKRRTDAPAGASAQLASWSATQRGQRGRSGSRRRTGRVWLTRGRWQAFDHSGRRSSIPSSRRALPDRSSGTSTATSTSISPTASASILFGHNPPFIREAIEAQLRQGFEIGPQSTLAGDVSRMRLGVDGDGACGVLQYGIRGRDRSDSRGSHREWP